jgi:D-alanyl-lipoteichoic acid acyltransferase DltB (MBOAT superfamily)
MNFATFEFAVFLACVYLPYLVLPHRQQNYLLLVASYFFYGWWDWRFLSLILFSTAVNYFVGLAIHNTENIKKRRFYLLISLVVTFGLLGIFKYLGFFVSSMVDLLEMLGFHPNVLMLSIVLPIGISFYTFQTTSYTIDIYRKEIPATRNFFDFALFVAFFPQLVAGPIERAKSLLPQIQSHRVITYDQVSRGSFLILWGLFKKIVIADGVAGAVESVYGMTSAQPTSLDIILATYLFAIQIYCDFSGYSDIARGTAKLLGFELVTNFNLPLFAVNPVDYWVRWHISLSNWLRDYVYLPLVTRGLHRGEWYLQSSIMITLFLSGIWHGAGWNFIFWGVFQGTIMCIHRTWHVLFVMKRKPPSLAKPQSPSFHWFSTFVKVILFFQVIIYGRLLFRAESFEQVIDFTKIILFDFTFHTTVNFSIPIVAIISIPLLLGLEFYQFVTNSPPYFYRKWPLPVRTLLYATLFVLLMAGMSNTTQEFIYFAF